MNIFYLDKDPCRAAELQYNKHVVKMILESAQMLCTAHRYYGNEDVPYKSTHLNHPSTVWVRENSKHYRWLFHHMLGLGSEYTKRYGRKHLTIDKCFGPLSFLPPDIPTTDFIQPPQAMPDEYKDKCSVKAYWSYYIGDKSHIAGKLEKPYVTSFVTKAL
jgi:hypothetical protein